MEPTTLANNVRRLRAERNLTKRALADAAGVSAMTVLRAEKGSLSPQLRVVERLAKALGTTAQELLFGGQKAGGEGGGR